MSFARPIRTFYISSRWWFLHISWQMLVDEKTVEFYQLGLCEEILVNGVRPFGKYTRDSYEKLLSSLNKTPDPSQRGDV